MITTKAKSAGATSLPAIYARNGVSKRLLAGSKKSSTRKLLLCLDFGVLLDVDVFGRLKSIDMVFGELHTISSCSIVR